MYDMYAWDRSASEAASDSEADKTDETDKTSETSPEPQAAVAAVQVALDRRDNGGPATAAAPVHAAR